MVRQVEDQAISAGFFSFAQTGDDQDVFFGRSSTLELDANAALSGRPRAWFGGVLTDRYRTVAITTSSTVAKRLGLSDATLPLVQIEDEDGNPVAVLPHVHQCVPHRLLGFAGLDNHLGTNFRVISDQVKLKGRGHAP